MADSVIIGFFLSLWRMLVGWYDGSGLARVINGICDFFKKRASGSAFVRAFMHGFCCGEWWQNSIIYRAAALPLTGRKKIAERNDGAVLSALLDIFNIPLRSIGAALVSFAAAMAAIIAVSGNISILNGAVAAAVAVIGALCVIFRQSVYSLYLGSKLFSFLGGFFYDGEYKAPADRKISLLPLCIFAAVLGAAGGATSPLLTTVIIAAVLFMAVVLARFEVGVFAVLFLAAFLPTAAVAGLCVLTIAGFALALLCGRVHGLKPSVLAPMLMMYVLFGAFATATSFHIANSAFIFIVYLVFIGAYIVMVNTLTTKARWRAAAVTFAAGALLIALCGILQNFTMDSTTQSWVDANMFEDIKTRVYATFDNPNVLGQYFIITIPIIFALFFGERNIPRKTAWLGVFAVCFLCLLYTWSRGAWVGVVLGIAVFLLLRDRRWIVLCILALLALPFVLPPSILNRLLSIGNTGDSSTAYRVSVWIASARMAMDFWMSGVGYGSDAFATVYSAYALNGAGFALHSHNFYIQLVVDMGIGGLVTFLLIVATAYREIALVRDRGMVRAVTLALAGVLVGYMFQGVAESLWYNLRMSLMFWIVMALAVSGAALDKEVRQ